MGTRCIGSCSVFGGIVGGESGGNTATVVRGGVHVEELGIGEKREAVGEMGGGEVGGGEVARVRIRVL